MGRIDLSKWGPLTWLVVISVVVIELFIGIYLIVAQPSTPEVEHFVGVMAGLLASPAVLAVAHAILRSGELRADASSAVQDPAVNDQKPTVSTTEELLTGPGVLRPEAASTPDPVEGQDTDPNARLKTPTP